MKKKLVVFDLDGTLLDTLEDIRRALNYALSPYDIPPVDREETRRLVGRGLRNALVNAVVESRAVIEENDMALMYELLLSSYLRHPSENTRPYTGIVELLEYLEERGVKVAVASNKKDEIVQKIVKNVLPSVHFAFVMGQRNGCPLKPDPEGILGEIGRMGITKDEIIYVGDSEVDYRTAENLGCSFVIVNYGFRTEDELEREGIYDTAASPEALKKKLEALIQ